MRTLRELAGFGLLIALVATPFAVLLSLVGMVEGDAPCVFLLFTALLVLSAPRLWLSAKRLRQPPPEEVAEADGRRPVLLLHRFTRVAEPLMGRLLLPSGSLLREVADELKERSLIRQLHAVGPVLPVARPGAPWLDDPSVPRLDPSWAEKLERLLPRAAMSAIVLDGSEANAHEIERAFETLGPRTILVFPVRKDNAFRLRYAALRERIARLPELSDPFAVAIRFDPEGRARLVRSLEIAEEERVRAPDPPLASWLLSALPIGAAFFSVVWAPLVLDGHGVDLDEGDLVAWTLGVLFWGGVMTVLTRRSMRIVPGNDVVLVTLAIMPWLVLEVIRSLADDLGAYSLAATFEHTATAAAYSAPLLASVALVLASASLLRPAPKRSLVHLALGAATVLPLGLLALSLGAGTPAMGYFAFALLVNGLALALAGLGASGEGAHAHAPMPIGAAVAAASSIAACAILATHEHWRTLLTQVGASEARAMLEHGGGPMRTFARVWPWLVLAIPLAIGLIGTRFRGRGTSTAMAGLAAFAPMMLTVSLSLAPESMAREYFDTPYPGASFDPLLAADGFVLDEGFALTEVNANQAPGGPGNVVLDTSGVYVCGELVATTADLARYRMTGPPQLTRALVAIMRGQGDAECLTGGGVNIAVRRDLQSWMLLSALASARTAGLGYVSVLVSYGDQVRSVALRSHDARIFPRSDRIQLFLQVRESKAAILASDGTRIDIPRLGRALDAPTIDERLRERRQQEPNRQDIFLAVDPLLPAADLIEAAAYTASYYPDVIVLEDNGYL
jgi:hypothetical protein